jgi:hypothetical protein
MGTAHSRWPSYQPSQQPLASLKKLGLQGKAGSDRDGIHTQDCSTQSPTSVPMGSLPPNPNILGSWEVDFKPGGLS